MLVCLFNLVISLRYASTTTLKIIFAMRFAMILHHKELPPHIPKELLRHSTMLFYGQMLHSIPVQNYFLIYYSLRHLIQLMGVPTT